MFNRTPLRIPHPVYSHCAIQNTKQAMIEISGELWTCSTLQNIIVGYLNCLGTSPQGATAYWEFPSGSKRFQQAYVQFRGLKSCLDRWNTSSFIRGHRLNQPHFNPNPYVEFFTKECKRGCRISNCLLMIMYVKWIIANFLEDKDNARVSSQPVFILICYRYGYIWLKYS